MNSLGLKDLRPEEAEIVIGEKTYKLRPVSLDDWAWMQKKFGKNVSELMESMPFSELTVICFRLLKDKTDFLPVQKTEYDDEGYPQEVKITGPEMLARALPGLPGATELTQAFSKAMGFGHVSEEQVEAIEKSATEKKTASQSTKPTGEHTMTS